MSDICLAAGDARRRPRADAAAGCLHILPVLVSAAPFALLLGSLAAQNGLSPLETALMSALVFAGSAQLVAVELWPEALATSVVAAVLLVNLRHVLMGAAITPHLPSSGRLRLHGALFFLADEIWALALRRVDHGLSLAYYLGLAVPLWLFWVAATTLGAQFGNLVEDPAAWGFDFAFTAIFLVLLAGLWRGPRRALPWLASAAAATLGESFLPGVWYILLGALAGVVVAVLSGAPQHEP